MLLVLLICGAVAAFFMAAKEELPYIIAKYKSTQVQDAFTDFNNGGDSPGDTVDGADPTQLQEGSQERQGRKNVPQDWNGIDWEGLQAMNPDILGWIRIPGTEVNYAILKGTVDDYYLNHHMDGSNNILGSIFLPDGTDKELKDAHTILYGHNMASGQMFGELSNFESQQFWSENPYVYIYTPDRTLKCGIYAAYGTKDNSDTYTLGYTLGSKDFKEWIRYTRQGAYYQTEFVPDGEKQIFTLSTCADYGVKNDRFVVNCVVLQEISKSSAS